MVPFLSFLASLIPGIVSSVASGVGASALGQVFGLSGAEREQNAFNANEAEKNREWQALQLQNQNAFNAAEAEKSRAFQAEQSNTAFQRGVADMQAAGLNPALAYGQGGASAMQGATASAGSAPSGSAASGSGRGLAVGLSDLMQMALMKKQIDKADSEIKNIDANTDLTSKNAEYRGLEVAFYEPLTQKQLEVLDSRLKSDEVERRLSESGISANEARALLDSKQALLAGIDSATRGYLNQLEARLRIARIAETYQNTAESRKRVELLGAQVVETLQRAVTEAAQAGLYDQQARNLLVEEGILQYDAKTKAYEASHVGITYWTRQIGQVVGAIGSAAIGFGAAGAGAKAFGLVGNAAASAPGKLWTPSSGSMFEQNWRYQ